MCDVTKEMWILQAIDAIGFCNFLFREKGVGSESGFILVADDDYHARILVSTFVDILCAKLVDINSQNQKNPRNYEIGIHRFHKYDKESDLIRFLEQTDYFSILIVGGLAPTCLQDHTYIFRFMLTERDVRNFENLHNKMRKVVVENVEHLLYELDHLNTSALFQMYTRESDWRIRTLVAAGKVWEMILREGNTEEAVERWLNDYCECASDAVNQMDDLEGLYDISETFRSIVVGYVRENEVKFGKKGYIHTEYDEEHVMYDEEHYYFPEKLLKKICLPIAQTVSFAQIKKELRDAGVLVCNDCKNQNFTVKIACYDKQNARIVRKRFLKIEKEAVISEEGLTLEEIAFFKTDEEEKTEWT